MQISEPDASTTAWLTLLLSKLLVFVSASLWSFLWADTNSEGRQTENRSARQRGPSSLLQREIWKDIIPLLCPWKGSLPSSVTGSLDLLLPVVTGCQWAKTLILIPAARVPEQGQNGWSHVIPVLLSSPEVLSSSPTCRGINTGKMPGVICTSHSCHSRPSLVSRPLTGDFICNLHSVIKKKKRKRKQMTWHDSESWGSCLTLAVTTKVVCTLPQIFCELNPSSPCEYWASKA